KCDDCPNEGVCTLNKVMVELRDSTLEILENKSLESLK
ncbi:MAG TPA: transcriptional regulator, partial [Flavobacteriaceae bacterium]|nr:transcriptional regulator [Flavobacteriaceae bacterium]